MNPDVIRSTSLHGHSVWPEASAPSRPIECPATLTRCNRSRPSEDRLVSPNVLLAIRRDLGELLPSRRFGSSARLDELYWLKPTSPERGIYCQVKTCLVLRQEAGNACGAGQTTFGPSAGRMVEQEMKGGPAPWLGRVLVVVDDLDGAVGAQTVTFSMDRDPTYTIDLAEHNLARLRDLLAPFIAASRRASARQGKRPDRALNREVRTWAAEEGIELNPLGRLPNSVLERFEGCAHRHS